MSVNLQGNDPAVWFLAGKYAAWAFFYGLEIFTALRIQEGFFRPARTSAEANRARCLALLFAFFLLADALGKLAGNYLLFAVLRQAAFLFVCTAFFAGKTWMKLFTAGMLLAVLTSAVILLYFERRPFSDLGLTLKGHARGLWYGLLAAILLYLIGFGLSLALGEVEVTGFQFDPLNLLATFVFCLLVALAEEIMMRGYILGRLLHTRMNKFLSLFVSALLFALLHLFNPNLAFLPMLNLLLAGMFIGASYLYTRNLCFPISLHLFWNWIPGPILGYQVSGNDFGTSLLTLHLPEENVLNGGAFGFEGSLICTVLMIIFTILIVWWGEKREAISLAVPRSC